MGATRAFYLTLFACLLVCPRAWAREDASQSFPNVPAVEVWGEASDTRPPDHAEVRVNVEARGATIEAAMQGLSPRVSGVLDAVREAGVRDQDTRSTGPTVTTDFEVTRDDKGREITEKRRIIGYRAEYGLQAETDRLDAVPAIVARISDAGGLVRSVEFSVASAKEIGRGLEERAAADGLERAKRLIRAVGAMPGRVLSIERETHGSADLPMRAPQPGVGTRPIEVRPGQITENVSMKLLVEMLSQ